MESWAFQNMEYGDTGEVEVATGGRYKDNQTGREDKNRRTHA